MSLLDTPADLRPREKMRRHGAAALADAELLALLLRTGVKGTHVVALAADLLRRFEGFAGLLAADDPALARVRGLGPAKRSEIAAVAEIARRALAERLQARPVFDAPQSVKDYVALHLGCRGHEVFAALFLDAQHRLIAMEELFSGTLTQTSVYPREVARRALQLNAAALIVAHNHPSGVAEPSRADEHLTHTLRTALALLDVRLLDHLVIGRGQVVSMAERGLV